MGPLGLTVVTVFYVETAVETGGAVGRGSAAADDGRQSIPVHLDGAVAAPHPDLLTLAVVAGDDVGDVEEGRDEIGNAD